MPIYQKRPVQVEARQFTVENWNELADWCEGITENDRGGTPIIQIPTLEGLMQAHPGDWIIMGVAGEFYPCKSDIFEKTYQPAPKPVSRSAMQVVIEHWNK